MLLLTLPALYRCADERGEDNTGDAAAQGEEQLVSFSIRVPDVGIPNTKTKALTADDENSVDHIVLLLFNTAGYTYHPINITAVTTNTGNSAIKTFTARVPQGTYDIVILANSSLIVSAAPGGINAGDSKASVMQRLLLSNAGKWNSDPAAPGYVKIPMWGEITGLTVGYSTVAQSAILVRMVSRIDVDLSSTAQAKFKLTSVRLYNYNDQGQVAPDDANWNSGTSIATAPTVPATASKPANPGLNPLRYDGTSITTTDIACENEIYTFEAEAGTSANPEDNTCLVIGGIYDTDGVQTFYRVDFANTVSSVTTYLPLKRNHLYAVTIADVGGSGFPTPEIAFNTPTVNITATIAEWNLIGLGPDLAGGNYILTATPDALSFTASAGNQDVDVYTDNAGGIWRVDKIADASDALISWLSAGTTSGPANTTTTVSVSVTANTGGTARTGYIHLKAGKLTKIITVDQNG
ncbi:hypothetical protein FACS1894179_03370 [Bacteroidia bacterium]|nr:hypothetical protein FACS1894179_03370 [Bacteroidia bacterium]